VAILVIAGGRLVMSISVERELLGVAQVSKVVLILGVFKMLKLYFKQSL
jgi:hypothetical protein